MLSKDELHSLLSNAASILLRIRHIVDDTLKEEIDEWMESIDTLELNREEGNKNIEIEKGIPISDYCSRIYHLSSMEVGDSFLARSQAGIITAKRWSARYNIGWEFKSRKEGNRIRVWRTK